MIPILKRVGLVFLFPGFCPAQSLSPPEALERYHGAAAYVFRLKPTQKRAGLFKGALWLDADTAAPLRLSGDFIHLDESPMLEQPDFKHPSGNGAYITPDDWPRVDAVIDWLVEKNRAGYKMVNSVRRLEEMKPFLRGTLPRWDCRVGQNSLIIRTDGTLAPCFPMYNAAQDWGVAGEPRFESRQLANMKVECQKRCFSTLNHNLAYCYNASRAIRWVLKQAANGFRGTTGSFED